MPTLRRPEWLKKKIEFDGSRPTGALLNSIGIHTVCREAKCPNISECFKKHHATFLILGKFCTRACLFCNVEKQQPLAYDPEEPGKVAEAVEKMDLKHVVVTSVTRDDLKDGGASAFADTVGRIRQTRAATIELLVPDFGGEPGSIERVARSNPEIFGHNIETVPRLYHLRPRANYARSLYVLKHAKKTNPSLRTKSALMLGLGEKEEEVLDVMKDLVSVGCDFLAIGQYLAPSLRHIPVAEYITPEKFLFYKKAGLERGFKHIEAAPYVRSSYNAENYGCFSTGIEPRSTEAS